MALVISDLGECILLDKMLKTALLVDEGYSLKLYTSVSPSISSGSIASDFTEATFTGYVAKSLTRSGWGSATTVAGKARSTYASAQTWTAASSQTIVGYYIVGATSGVLLWAESFSDAKSLISGDALTVTPIFEFSSAN